MPGLIGVIERSPDARIGGVFQAIAAPMKRGGRMKFESLVDRGGRWALGRLHLGTFEPEAQLSEGSKLQALFHGDLHNEAELRRSLGEEALPAKGPRSGAASVVLPLYRKHGIDFASHLRGAFLVAILDEEAGRLILANDILGTYPLCYLQSPTRFTFASELKSVLKDPATKKSLAPRAVADYLHYGFLFGEKTLAEGVQLLPAASTLVYHWEDGSVEISLYRRVTDFFSPWEGTRESFQARLTEVFSSAVGRSFEGKHRFLLSLSGGLDSRAILSGVDCAKLPLSTYTLGVKGCADEVIAEKLHRIAGTSHRFFELDQRYLSDFLPNLRRMVSLTDGMYLTHGLTEMLALRFLEETDLSVLVRGHCGELAKASLAWPFHTDAKVFAMRAREEFLPYFLGRVNYITPQVSLRDLLTDSWFERVEHGARLSLEESLRDVPLSPADCCSYVYLHEHHRRFTVASLELFRNVLEIRLPFADQEFLECLFRAPSLWRDGTDIHRGIMRALNPALLKVRNSNTGAPGNAGPFLEKVLDKFNSLFKRLNVHGYRHYHNFEAWMKRMLIEAVETVLLGRDALARAIYKEQVLRRLIDETKRGAVDHAYLFQVLLILALWQEENL